MTTAAISLPALPNPLADGWTLPASWYTDLAVQERERVRVFARAWTYAGPAEWVSEPGSYFSAHIGHIPVAVVRGTDGTLRGLVNVCRHRGHLVVDGTGCRETLQCPYHAWTYELDGRLRSARQMGPDFDGEGFGGQMDYFFIAGPALTHAKQRCAPRAIRPTRHRPGGSAIPTTRCDASAARPSLEGGRRSR